MNECDRLKKHISDYLKNTLDNTSKTEFEKGLSQDPQLRNLTDQVNKMSKMLTGLKSYKCSDDFSVKLREKIHRSDSQAKLPATPAKKYSYAFSFVVVAVLATFMVTAITDEPDNVNTIPETTNIKEQIPSASPTNQPNPGIHTPASEQQVDIKTIDEQKVPADSLRNQRDSDEGGQIKQVDTKKQ